MQEKEIRSRYGIVNFERRKYPRFNVDLPIEYCFIDSSTEQSGRAMNVSEGGLLVYLPDQVEIGQHLRLQLFFPSGSSLNTIEMRAEVAWSDIHLGKDWGDYRCGLRFIEITPDDLNKLRKFIGSLSE
jgi:c-di-GMP-binding flagellar brake protein YcgR